MAIKNLNTILTASLEKSRKKLIYASLTSNPLFAYLLDSGKIESVDGGTEISNPIITGRNTNVTSYSYYDRLPVSQTDEFKKIKYGYARYGGSVIISEQEVDENAGESKIFDLYEQKLDVLQKTFEERFSTDLYGLGEGKNFNGLALLVPDDPTSGVVGGLDRATNPQWRTMAYNMNGALTSDNIEEIFDKIFMEMAQGKNNKPDIIIAGRDIYNMYKTAIRKLRTIQFDGAFQNKMLDLGFDTIAFGNVKVLYDENCPVNKAYFLNTEHLKFHVFKNVNMRVKDLNAPIDLDVFAKRVTWQGQLCLWKANRTQAVIIN